MLRNPQITLAVLRQSFDIVVEEASLRGRNAVLGPCPRGGIETAGACTTRTSPQEAGAILVSSALKEYTETDPSLDFELRGEFRFKGLLGDHVVYEVRWQVASPGPPR